MKGWVSEMGNEANRPFWYLESFDPVTNIRILTLTVGRTFRVIKWSGDWPIKPGELASIEQLAKGCQQ